CQPRRPPCRCSPATGAIGSAATVNGQATTEEQALALYAVAACLVLVTVGWFVPAATAWLFVGTLLPLNPFEATVWTVHVLADPRWTDPAAAYPAGARAHMPAAAAWWAAAGWALLVAGATAVGAWR